MKEREILVGVTGGIAAYKTADLVSQLVQRGAKVSVVMTESATKFIGKTTFEALTGRPVNVGLFNPQEHPQGEHIGLARRAEIVVIAPATASTLARVANGMSDDLLSTCVLVTTAPVLLAPAMNCEMWDKSSVQRNVKQIKDDGHEIIEPGSGWLSCGQVGAGRMAEPTEILQHIEKHFD
jgi:phosphopantothenoylcysteine decarboxylase/phosphopantothenate--cysteine ligase